MERERRGKQAGLRTFALACLLGAMGGLLGTPYALAALGLLGILVLLTTIQAMRTDQDLELTTSAALCVVGFIGVMCGIGHTLTPVAVGVVVAALLSWKERMVPLSVGLTEEELRSAILLGIIALAIYPALPSGAVDPWGLVDVQAAWTAVILIAALGFVNYILLKRYGSRGVELTGFLGGLISTKVTNIELAQRERDSNGALRDVTYAGFLLSRASMVLRNGFIMAALSLQAFAFSAPSLILMFLGAISFLLRRRLSKYPSTEPPSTLNLGIKAPFSLPSVIKFGMFFLVLQIAGVLASRAFGSFGFYIVTAIGSIFSSASAITSAAALAASGSVSHLATGISAVIASIVSSIVDTLLVARISKDEVLTEQIAIGVIWICGLAIVGMIAVVVFSPFGY